MLEKLNDRYKVETVTCKESEELYRRSWDAKDPGILVKSWIFLRKRMFDIDKLHEEDRAGIHVVKCRNPSSFFLSVMGTSAGGTAIIIRNIANITVAHDTC